MSEDFTLKRVPKSVTDAINSATDASSLRELALNSMAEAGIIVRTRDDDFNFRLNPDGVARPAAPSLPAGRPAQEPTHSRIIYPHLNDRYEITGMSKEELDQKEARIRAMFSGQ